MDASEDISSYLQVYLDETDEEVEGLMQALLTLEAHPAHMEALNEAFRLTHSIKGSSGMMGLVQWHSRVAPRLGRDGEIGRTGIGQHCGECVFERTARPSRQRSSERGAPAHATEVATGHGQGAVGV